MIRRSFFARSVHEVAEELIGATFLVDGVGGKIVEVEAYHHEDPAAHGYGGRTARNASMFCAHSSRPTASKRCASAEASRTIVSSVPARAGSVKRSASRSSTTVCRWTGRRSGSRRGLSSPSSSVGRG